MKVISRELPDYEELEIYPLSDAHWEDSNCDRKKLLEWRDMVMAEDNRYVVLLGDLLNAATKFSKSDIYSSTDSPDGALDDVIEFLEPISDRIIAIVGGNHEARIYKESGMDPTYRMARELGLQDVYSPDAFLLFLSFGRSQGRACRKQIYSIYARHGSGGGKKAGGKVNSLIDTEAVIDADVFIMGHTHQVFATKKVFYRADYRNKKVTPVTKLFVNSNAWLRYGGYGETLGFSPAAISWPVIKLHGEIRKMQATI